MLLFKSFSSFFEVTGLFGSTQAANEFMEKNPDSGCIHEFGLKGTNSSLIVVCKIEESDRRPAKPVHEIHTDDALFAVSITQERFFDAA